MKPPKILISCSLVLIATLALSSCGTFKRALKSEKATTAKVEDSTVVKAKRVDSSAVDRTVMREKVDTTITIAGTIQTGSKPLDNIVAGDSLVIENGDQKVAVTYDPLTGNLRARGETSARPHRVLIDRETERTQALDVSREDISAKAGTKAETQATENRQVNSATKIGPDWQFWVALFIVVGSAVGLFVVFYKLKP